MRVVAPVIPALAGELAEQGRREPERLVAEDLLGQDLQRLALLRAGDGDDGSRGPLSPLWSR